MSYDLWLDAPYQEPEPCRHPRNAWREDMDGVRYCDHCGLREDEPRSEDSSND